MGNGPYVNDWRGDDDVNLTALINSLTEEEFAEFLRLAEENGKLEASEYKDKAAFFEDWSTFKKQDKDAILENLKRGKGPFDD